ncbi:MAG TPA: hypothetical protein VEG60_08395, partial [Candidatus Binatia bacterium]|nr:hypothetical protein [Candidatus Binatia bacterium]
CYRPPAIFENLECLLVGPVEEDALQNVSISTRRDTLKEVSCDQLASWQRTPASRFCRLDRRRLIEQHR